MKKSYIVLLITLAVFLMIPACAGNQAFVSPYPDENGKLFVENGLSTDVVLFKNELKESSKIDHMSALQKTTYNLQKDGFVVIMAILETDYKTKNLSEIRPIFSELLYYNSLGEVYNVSVDDNPFPSGDSEITFDNRSKYWVELHKGNAKGEILTVLPPESIDVLNMQPGEYDIFPVFVYLMKAGFNENVVGMERLVLKEGVWTRRYDSGKQYFEKIPGADLDNMIQYDKGYLSVINNSDDGFRVMNGATRLVTGTNLSLINPGERLVFEIEQVGQEWKQLNISSKRIGEKEIPAITFAKGMVYEVEIDDLYEPTLLNEGEGTPVREFKDRIGK